MTAPARATRVASATPNKAAGSKRVFEEKASRKAADVRAELQALLKFAEQGDIIVVTKLGCVQVDLQQHA